MRYLCITGGPLAENCYFLIDEASGEAAVIDPASWTTGCSPRPQNTRCAIFC